MERAPSWSSELPPVDRDFAAEIERALRLIACRQDLRTAMTNFNGEVRSMARILEIAANCFGRPLAPHKGEEAHD